MWILKFLPESLIHLSLIASVIAVVVGSTLGNLSFIKKYALGMKIIGGIVLVITLFLEGALHDNAVWEERVLEVEAKLAKAEAQSAKENTKIVEKVAEKQAKVKEKTLIVKQYIDREVTKYDNTCVIPQPFIKALNDAAEGPAK